MHILNIINTEKSLILHFSITNITLHKACCNTCTYCQELILYNSTRIYIYILDAYMDIIKTENLFSWENFIRQANVLFSHSFHFKEITLYLYKNVLSFMSLVIYRNVLIIKPTFHFIFLDFTYIKRNKMELFF